MKEFKTYDLTILKLNKKYFWSGCSENLYTSYKWNDNSCKIIKIENNKIFIYDYYDNKEYDYDNNSLKENNVLFIKKNLKNVIKTLLRKKH